MCLLAAGLDYICKVIVVYAQGNNVYARRHITEVLGYLTWEKAFLCLVNEQLPDKLRAKYCKLLAGVLIYLVRLIIVHKCL